LSVYSSPRRLWTNEILAAYKGTDQGSLIQPSRQAPEIDGETKLFTEPRQSVENWYFKKTFGILKYFSGLG
jgi:hypothetical protein